jgi:hypothetical protein
MPVKERQFRVAGAPSLSTAVAAHAAVDAVEAVGAVAELATGVRFPLYSGKGTPVAGRPRLPANRRSFSAPFR